jgi:hypothetical protein
LEFRHPRTSEMISLNSQLPAELHDFLVKVEK